MLQKALAWKEYVLHGVWREPRNTFKVRLIKTLNLSVRAFTNRGLQSKSMALTYTTVLAVVPALALMVAIARGFGLQDLIMKELYQFFPSQHKMLSTAMTWVDSYLNQSTQGVFVGVGIIMLMWTLISLMSSIDDTFNQIWGIKQTRSMFQKISDYIALCLIVPLLMLCSAGASIFISTVLHSSIKLPFLTPLVNWGLEALPLVLAWLAFSFSYFFIPNTKVKFKYAAIAGAFAAIGFGILQALFVNGQIYVSKYNAIYGSFAFLPLMLVWMQLSWLILLSGCVLTNSMQNVLAYDYLGSVADVSHSYLQKLYVAVMAIIVHRFERREEPLTKSQICANYNLPGSLVSLIIEKLHQAGLVYYVVLDNHETAIAPSIDITDFTVGDLFKAVSSLGQSDFVPYFHAIFGPLIKKLDESDTRSPITSNSLLLRELPVPDPKKVQKIMDNPKTAAFPSVKGN